MIEFPLEKADFGDGIMVYSPSSSSGWGTVQVRGEGGMTRDARLQRRHPVKEKEKLFRAFF